MNQRKLSPESNRSRLGWSCFEVFAAIILLSLPLGVGLTLTDQFSPAVGVYGAIATAYLSVTLICVLYSYASRLDRIEMQKLEERYRSIYRVIAISQSSPRITADGTNISVGDYGWEAEPMFKDGLLYLQGLNEKWQVVWYAGFQPEQLERICDKPRSQYYLPNTWVCAGAQPPPCPFPVLSASTASLGFPQRVMFPFIQGIKVKHPDKQL